MLNEILEKILQKLVEEARKKDGRKPKDSLIIIDSQSVKNTDCAKEKGYDAGKKVCGIKRHIAVDTNGFPHAILVTTCDITDRNGAIEMITNKQKHLLKVKNVLADGGYSPDIRRVIYTTNIVEGFHRHVRKITKPMVVFHRN